MRTIMRFSPLFLLLLVVMPVLAAPQMSLLLPLGRVAFQTNEQIDLSVVRSDTAALPATDLAVTLTSDEGSVLNFTFSLAAVPQNGATASTVDHLRFNAWLLRPGNYAVAAAAYGATAQTKFELYSHLRKSTFKLFPWGTNANTKQQEVLGEDSMGFNMLYAGGKGDGSIRAGIDYMNCCTMSGAHQMDLRGECDWSDPYVLQGGEARVVKQALFDRTNPNCIGVHYYDEPGLTWVPDPETGGFGPLNVYAQWRSFESAFGARPDLYHPYQAPDGTPSDAEIAKMTADDIKKLPAEKQATINYIKTYGRHPLPVFYRTMDAKKPEDAALWKLFATWKLGFMDAAWKYAQDGVKQVDPHFLNTTQSQYGWPAFTDGYYFNVARSLPVISGHGGYSDNYPGHFLPLSSMLCGRMRQLDKPNWYLPCWYNMNAVNVRLEQNLCFANGVQGMATPPWYNIYDPFNTSAAPEADGSVESNKLMGRLGTIFSTKMQPERPQVAVLYSLSQIVNQQTKDLTYQYGWDKGGMLANIIIACHMAQTNVLPIVDEDILDGTAAGQKVIIVTNCDYLDPKVIAALQGYITGGGTVLLTDECKVQIPGAVKLGAINDASHQNKLSKMWADSTLEKDTKKQTEMRAQMSRQNDGGYAMKTNEPLAKALKAFFAKQGIKPAFDSTNMNIVGTRQTLGEIDYLFAVNATADLNAKERETLIPAATTISFPADARPVYDAMHPGTVPELQNLKGTLRFGAGEMRVFARSARPIGGVELSPVKLARDNTQKENPLNITFSCRLMDNKGGTLYAVAPLEIRVVDPLGAVRYDLYRATEDGQLTLTLPLAANDPAGKWTVTANELLAGTKAAGVAFTYQPATTCGALAGALPRAVYFGNDREQIFHFFRLHQDVTIVKGSSAYDSAAADRLVEILKPWNIRCSIVNAADVNHPRPVSADEAPTWVGLTIGRLTVNEKSWNPILNGFDVKGPVILVGNPTDNPLLAFAENNGFLPYKVNATFPGAGRGYIAWQRDAVSYQAESVAVIATDAQGMAEAVGSLYEACAGMDPLMELTPATVTVKAAQTAAKVPEAAILWSAVLPDRATTIAVNGATLAVTTMDGSKSTLDAKGKVVKTEPVDAKLVANIPPPAKPMVPAALTKSLLARRIVKFVATANGTTAVGYWGGAVQTFAADGTLKTQQQFPQDIAAMAMSNGMLAVSLSDGTLVVLGVK